MATAAAWADDDQFLADTHTDIGLPCAACHIDAPSFVAPSTAICTSCHGLSSDIAALSAEIEPNPHASHKGDLACESCHRAHSVSVDACAQCHDWGYDIP